VIVFELGAPVRRERVFDAEAEQQADQSGAALQKVAGKSLDGVINTKNANRPAATLALP